MRSARDCSLARRRYARYLLADVRLINGSIGLVRPEQFIKRFDPERELISAANVLLALGAREPRR